MTITPSRRVRFSNFFPKIYHQENIVSLACGWSRSAIEPRKASGSLLAAAAMLSLGFQVISFRAFLVAARA